MADTYTYIVPPELEAQIVSGSLVSVAFGKKQYIGLVVSIHRSPPHYTGTIKPVLAIESAKPVIRQSQLPFWRWISSYYFCKPGDLYKAVVPAGYRSGKTPKRKRKSKGDTGEAVVPLNRLSPKQEEAMQSIRQGFEEKDVCLLHGVTSSGKTEIYTRFIQETLDRGEEVLYLLPEIALTTQITGRLWRFFGERLSVYHSGISNGERIRLWNRLLDDESDNGIVLGARSAIFLPFRKLGLIIVDEEHEPSYKQQEPAPRYHARNAAIVLAKEHGAKVLLGSATPSVESYHNVQIGKYAYAKLDSRYQDVGHPAIAPVDVKELRRKKKMKGIFSPVLQEKMGEALANDEQVILFQNRRGFAPAILCRICDWTPKCRFCDISLSYHKGSKLQLSCHYCGRTYQVPRECPECGSTDLKPIGFGTEKVEEEIKALFPEAMVERMDADSAGTKKQLEGLIHRFETGETQILIGTQMLSKGLDFGKVSLVGILNADGLMNFPDFRSYERAYQLMSQVSGRAGRRKKQGEVILQTSHPDHPLIHQVIEQDYDGMYEMQAGERELFRYPPFYRLIYIHIKHRNEAILNPLSDELAYQLRLQLGDRVLGPDKPLASRAKNLYMKRILLKIELNASHSALYEMLMQIQNRVLSNKDYRYAVVQYDVDPV